MMTYRDFVKKNLKHYIRAGLSPQEAMKEVAKDWRRWKMGIGNPLTVKCRLCYKPFTGEDIAEAYNKVAEHWKKEHGYIPRLANPKGVRPRCPKCGKSMRLEKYWLCPYCGSTMNPISLYESFHGSPPLRQRKISYEPPPKGKPLVKVGRISQINYIPEFPSKKSGTEFYHLSGDTGEKTLKSNLILATDQDGKNLYLLKDKKSKHPFFSSRGLIG